MEHNEYTGYPKQQTGEVWSSEMPMETERRDEGFRSEPPIMTQEFQIIKEGIPTDADPLFLEEKNEDTKRFVLRSPVVFEGKEYREITLDFDRLSGKDLERASESVSIAGRGVVIELSKQYQAAVAARAAGLPREFMSYVSARDYTAITMEAMNFLMD